MGTQGRFILLCLLALSASVVQAETTTGGVNWLDPVGYTKPAFYPITVPTESTVTNKWYVDQTAGGGTACTQVSPCSTITAVAGKAGTTGGPAYIYVKGNGKLSITGTLYGSAGNEIVIKPWPGETNVVTFNKSGSNTGDANTVSGSGVHHLIFDGGPNLLFSFTGSGSTQNAYVLTINSSDITMYRVRLAGGSAQGPALGIATGTGTTIINNVRWINSEIYNTPNYYGVYTGGGTSCSAGDTRHTNLYFINSIFRDICGRGIQIEPRASSNGVWIEGNAFHDGFDGLSCGVSISRAVTPADACGGSLTNTFVRNNLAFELGGGFMQFVGTNIFADNNTIYRYGKSSPITTGSHGFTGTGTARNNIVHTPVQAGVYDFDPNHGTITQVTNLTSGTLFASTNSADTTYLQLSSGSAARNSGTNLASSWVSQSWPSPTDYRLAIRPTAPTAWDIGATQFFTSGGIRPTISSLTCNPTTIQSPGTTDCTVIASESPFSYTWSTTGCAAAQCVTTSNISTASYTCQFGGSCTPCVTATNTTGTSDLFCAAANYLTVRYRKPTGLEVQ